MKTASTISPLDQFEKAFPFIKWITHSQELCYPFLDIHWTARAEQKARLLILAKRLPLVTFSEMRPFGKSVRSVLIVQPVPEEYTFTDEVQDDEIYHEEKAEWL